MLGGDFERLTNREVSGILQRGGTICRRPAREFRTEQGQRKGLRRLNEHENRWTGLYRRDGSLRGALALHKLGFPVVGIPGALTRHRGTNMSIGVDTARIRILHSAGQLAGIPASSHGRPFHRGVGRNCGYLALMGGIPAGRTELIQSAVLS